MNLSPSSTLRLVACSLSILGFALSTTYALDLTPRHGFRQGNEGPSTPVIQFADGNGLVSYVPPPDWRPSGSGKLVTFFTADPTSWMKLEIVAKSGPLSSGDASLPAENMQAWAAKFLPPGVGNVEFVRMVPAPWTIGASQSTECIFNFTMSGVRATISISAVDLSAKELLVIRVRALEKNFEHIREQAITSMFSWSPAG
ncbi:MAG: hypothetical protein ABJF10_02410 [Chthoniobacter sp.]|uniref:hypothetical protein n=1 Tax=Chthoniobacter sp. TaxID=2510640 RepID=UPI0032A798EB